MSDEPRKRTATEAMRLRPGADPEVVRERTAGTIDSLEAALAERGERIVQLGERLDRVLELHAEALVGLCRECLTPHPCSTVLAAQHDPATPTPREDSTQ